MAVREQYVVGVDFGTLSGRAVVVRVADGAELGTGVHDYPHGVLERELPDGTELPPDWALQVPEDYREVLRVAVPAAVAAAGIDPADVIGIGTDFTAVGRRAIQIIQAALAGEPAPERLISPELVVRASSVAPARRPKSRK